MRSTRKVLSVLPHYINGKWVQPKHGVTLVEVVNPSNEEKLSTVIAADNFEIDLAANAAWESFKTYGRSTISERIELLKTISNVYQKRSKDLSEALSQEMGAPISLARDAQVPSGLLHLQNTLELLNSYPFKSTLGKATIYREPIGVCAMITPWNWPLNQITCKVFPALAAGCTMILKPSEVCPKTAHIFAEVLQESGVPNGVFNMVHGGGNTGSLLSGHPKVDMVSFTGSQRAGVAVAKAAADSVKRVSQELGGKSPCVILSDADLQRAIRGTVLHVMLNSGQSCNAPTRLFVPRNLQKDAVDIAIKTISTLKIGPSSSETTTLGPVSNLNQYNKVREYIKSGIEEGATLSAGGLERPNGVNNGYYIQPTIFSDVRNDMKIAREEIFGPVVSILPYETDEEAIQLANDTIYGLAGYVWGKDKDRLMNVVSQLRAGSIHVNGAKPDWSAPFGGFKQSGNGREWGKYGLEEYLEVKSVLGHP